MLLWSIARAAGLVAFAAYTVTICWGILVAGKAFRPAAPQVLFHRFLASLGAVALATHVAALLLDHYAKVRIPMVVGIGARAPLIPGVVAFWLVIALPLSFRLRRAKLLSYRAWRRLHWLGYAVWALSLAHGIWSGTDTRSPFAAGLYAASGGLVAGLAMWRHSAAREGRVTAQPEMRRVPEPGHRQ